MPVREGHHLIEKTHGKPGPAMQDGGQGCETD